MTVDLEISDEQRDKLLGFVDRATTTARDKYIGSLKKDERTKIPFKSSRPAYAAC